MKLTPGMIVHSDCVLQHHRGKCSRCKEKTHGVLVGPPLKREWYNATRVTEEIWQIHGCENAA